METLQPTPKDYSAEAEKFMEGEDERKKMTQMRESMRSALEKNGKTGYLTKQMDEEWNDRDEKIDYMTIEGEIDGHRVYARIDYDGDQETGRLWVDGNYVSELFPEFQKLYIDSAYDLDAEKELRVKRENRKNEEQSIEAARKILF
jgi:hypothetical protein